MPGFKDLTGKRFGKLTALRRVGNNRHGDALWMCLCDCGKEKITRKPGKDAKSCGCSQFKRKPAGESARHSFLSTCREGANRREIAWSVSDEEFLQAAKQNCFYCGCSPMSRNYKGSNGGYITNGVDRVNNKIGYLSGNIVACCTTCNVAKREMSHTEFRDWVKRISGHLAANPPPPVMRFDLVQTS